MPNEQENVEESVIDTGSSNTEVPEESGETATESSEEQPVEVDLDDYVPKEQYEELGVKLGTQGEELGRLREFAKQVTPFLDALRGKDDVARAIMSGSLDNELAKAIVDGKISLKDAKAVSKSAHVAATKAMSEQGFTKEDIERLVDQKVTETKRELEQKVTNVEDLRAFEDRTNRFIESTNDFPDYAREIDQWLEAHPDQSDIEVAYYAVKGRTVTAAAAKEAEKQAAEQAKRVAANAGGGSSQGGRLPDGTSLIDSLISSIGNPNA